MKSKAFGRKLVLKKQTVSNLGNDALKAVVAGDDWSQCRYTSCPYTTGCPTGYTCDCTDDCGTLYQETCDTCTTCGQRVCEWSYYPNSPC
jgi:hypothetical protein